MVTENGNVSRVADGWSLREELPFGYGAFGEWSFGGMAGTLSVPLTQAPASVIVRHRVAGVTQTELAVLDDGTATFADGVGTLAWDGTTLTVGTTREAEVVGLIAYPDVVSDGMLQRVAAMEHWNWSRLMDRIGGIIRISLPEPLAIGRVSPSAPLSIMRTGGDHGE